MSPRPDPQAARERERLADALELLALAATPAPWKWDDEKEQVISDATTFEEGCSGRYAKDGVRWNGSFKEMEGTRIIETDGGAYPPRQPDRAFILWARNNADALLAALREPCPKCEARSGEAMNASDLCPKCNRFPRDSNHVCANLPPPRFIVGSELAKMKARAEAAEARVAELLRLLRVEVRPIVKRCATFNGEPDAQITLCDIDAALRPAPAEGA